MNFPFRCSTPLQRGFFLLTGWLILFAINPLLYAAFRLTVVSSDADQGVQIRLTEAGSTPVRLEVSTDFQNWKPVGLFNPASAQPDLTDSTSTRALTRFYRAVAVDPVTAIYRVTPDRGSPGDTVEIIGQYFGATPSANQITLGSTPANVLEATSTRLKVEVPIGASSASFLLKTTTGDALSPDPFLVLDTLQVRLSLPSSLTGQPFVVLSTSDVVPATNGLATVQSPAGFPTLISAIPQGTNIDTFLSAVHLGQTNRLTLDATSTAHSLVFQFPLLMTFEPERAAHLLALMQADLAVKDLVNFVTSALANRTNPLDASGYALVYEQAVISIVNSPALAALAAEPAPRRTAFEKQAAGPSTGVYPLEPFATRWVELPYDGKKGGYVLEAFQHPVGKLPRLLNPVDWVVRFQEVEPDLAFPNGRDDILASLRDPDPQPIAYPLRPGYDRTANISADLIFARFNILSYVSKAAFKEVTKFVGLAKESSIKFPNTDAIYAMRAIGPSFLSSWGSDLGFVDSNYPDEHARAIGVNLIAMMIDVLSAAIDKGYLDSVFDKDSKDQDKLSLKTFDEAVKIAPSIRSASDILPAVMKLGQFFTKELASLLLKTGFDSTVKAGQEKAAGYFAAKEGNYLKVSKAMTGIFDNKALKIISSLGQVAERIDGFIETSPVETTLVVVGDPFRLVIESVVPSTAGPGADVEITFKGSRQLRAFNPNVQRDAVSIEGSDSLPLSVSAVKGPDAAGRQTLTARIPSTVSAFAEGNYTLFVNTQGRKGSSPFKLTIKTVITGLAPTNGFAATANFAGNSFDGTRVFIQGANMSASDSVLFTGLGGTIPAKSKFAATGGLTVNVPAGAVTGPIVVTHTNLANREVYMATSHVFTALGPPVIQSMTPAVAAVGDYVQFRVLNLDGNFGTVQVLFPTNYFPTGVSLGGSNLIYTTVPTKTVSGLVRVVTPAGEDTRLLTVIDAPPRIDLTGGSLIPVGPFSPISLARAVALANGDGFVDDDTDYQILDNRRIDLDPPREEGDYITPDNLGATNVVRFQIGLNFADTINVSGPVSGAVILRGNQDSIAGDGPFANDVTLAGNRQSFFGTANAIVTLSGHFNALSGTFNGPIVITGNSNRLSGRYRGPILIEGDYNILNSAEYNGTITIMGSHNSVGQNTANIRSNTGPAVIVYGNENKVAANFKNNAGDAVIVDGGWFNTIDFNSCVSNGGNGIVLTGGASYNQVIMRAGANDPITRKPARGTGNNGHAVYLQGDASFNTLSGEIWGNGGDGLRLEGPGVHHNTFSGSSTLNEQNGITVLNGAHDNKLGSASATAFSFSAIHCDGNGQNGVAILGGLQTTGAFYCSSNGANGLLISGVNETVPDGTYFFLLTAAFSSETGNQLAGLRLENVVRGVRVVNPGYKLKLDGTGIELDGAGVTGNTLELNVTESRTNGVVVRKASGNNLKLSITKCMGPGLVLEGASDNNVRLSELNDNQDVGLRVTGGSFGNHFQPSAFTAFVGGNRTGAIIEGGSHDNVFEGLGFNKNGDYAAILTGLGTRNNVFLRTVFVGALKDGLLVEAGASDNEIGRVSQNPLNNRLVLNARDNGLAGIRITGPTTRGNNVANCLFLPTGNTLQPAGLLIENGAPDTSVHDNTFFRNVEGVLLRDGARGTILLNNRFQSNTVSAVTISNAQFSIIGGPAVTDPNNVFNNAVGVLLTGPNSSGNTVFNNFITDNTDGVLIQDRSHDNTFGPDNLVQRNVHGFRLESARRNQITRNTITDNPGNGVDLSQESVFNRVTLNTIARNNVGIHAHGASTHANTFLQNSIANHGGPRSGILLTGSANGAISEPRLIEIQSSAVAGTSTAPDESIIELFQDSADEGEIYLGTTTVNNGRFRVPVTVDPNQAGFLFNLTATVTDPSGNTSEFGMLYREDYPPARVLFSSTRDGNAEIYGAGGNAPTATPKNLTNNRAEDTHPTAAPGCDTLLFVSDRETTRHIFVTDVATGASPRRLTTDTAADYDPAWLVVCKKVVFVSERDGNPEIYSINLDGTGLTRLTTNSASDTQPTPTPDGNQIVFTSTRSGSKALWIMSADGLNQRPFLAQGLSGSQPAWSPDGTTLAFVSDAAGSADIYTIRLGDLAPLRVTTDPASDVDPAWVPGANTLVFSSNRTGNYELYGVSRTGGTAARLTVTTGDNRSPVVLPQ